MSHFKLAAGCGLVRNSLLFWLLLACGALPAGADIYQWEYVDHADPSKGVRQSSNVCVNGFGVTAAPGANLNGRNLEQAYLAVANLATGNLLSVNLTRATLEGANLIDANWGSANLSYVSFVGANLTGVSCWSATLTNADLRGAIISGASFARSTTGAGSGLSSAQL